MPGILFEEFVGDRATFFAEYFRNKPMLRKAALAGRVAEILSIEQMNDVVQLEAVGPSYVRLTMQGKALPARRFTHPVVRPGEMLRQVIDPDKIYSLYHEGATIAFNALDHHLPPVRRVLQSVTEAFACGGEAVAFLTPPGSPGFAVHTDPVDIFVLHIEGTKTWHIWDRLGYSTGFRAETLGDPSIEITLHAGDVLYIPPDTPHSAAAQESGSLHLGLSVEARRWRDLLHECLDTLMDETYQDAPYLGIEYESASVAGFASRLGDLQARLGDVDAAAELDRLRSRLSSGDVSSHRGFSAVR